MRLAERSSSRAEKIDARPDSDDSGHPCVMVDEKDLDEAGNAILQPDGRLLVIFEDNDRYNPYTWSKTRYENSQNLRSAMISADFYFGVG